MITGSPGAGWPAPARSNPSPRTADTPPPPPWQYWGTYPTADACTQMGLALKTYDEARVTRCFLNAPNGYDPWYEV